MSKEHPATSDNGIGRSEYVFRLDIPKLLEITTARGDSTGYKINRRTGIPESSVYRYLSGEAQPDLNSAMRLAEAYDCDLREVIKRVPIEVAA
ncbi:helix-turn-helix domain-containing protein [Streptomyces sp. NPDC091292]|uniref:helix-turn-helix domain-containing protein n=1 Tax=Streptomyces sp. NPDC091292 TaxID=3365991 RepID=UPI00382D89A5